MTHICVSKITIICSDNGLSPGRRQAIIWTSVGILLIGPLGTNFSEILIEIYTFSFKKMHLKMSSGKWRPLCLGLNVITVLQMMCRGIEALALHRNNYFISYIWIHQYSVAKDSVKVGFFNWIIKTILMKIHQFSSMKMDLKISSATWRLFS